MFPTTKSRQLTPGSAHMVSHTEWKLSLKTWMLQAGHIIAPDRQLLSVNQGKDSLSRDVRKPDFCICENKDADQISAFVFAAWIVPSLCFLNPKYQVCSHLLWLYSPVCVGPGRKPWRPVFWRRGSFKTRFSHDSTRLLMIYCILLKMIKGPANAFSLGFSKLNITSAVKGPLKSFKWKSALGWYPN